VRVQDTPVVGGCVGVGGGAWFGVYAKGMSMYSVSRAKEAGRGIRGGVSSALDEEGGGGFLIGHDSLSAGAGGLVEMWREGCWAGDSRGAGMVFRAITY